MVCIVFVFGIILCSGATAYRSDANRQADVVVDGPVFEHLGDLKKTMYSLLLASTGGISWGEIAQTASEVGSVYFVVFNVYNMLMMISVLNIVTGITVDGAIHKNNCDRSVKMEQEQGRKKAFLADLLEVLEKMDERGNGRVDENRFSELMADPIMVANMDFIGVPTYDASLLFKLLDLNSDGDISHTELIDGLYRLKGSVSSFDAHEIMNLVNVVLRQTEAIHNQLAQVKRVSLLT